MTNGERIELDARKRRRPARRRSGARALVVLARMALVPCALFLVRPASADPATDRQVAQSLFEQARELMAKNDFVRACPMLAESQKLDPGGGTRLNLALCYEGEGKLASAHLELSDALAQAIRDGRTDREEIAREHLAAITPRVPKLTLAPPSNPAPGLVVELDGVAVSTAALGLSLQVDPGPHEVRAVARGYEPWLWRRLVREKESVRVQLPNVEDLHALGSPAAACTVGPCGAAPERQAPPFAKTTKKLSTPSWVLFGVGGAALVASTLTGFAALSAQSTYEHECFEERDFCPTSTGADAAAQARGLAWASTGLLIGGLAAVAVGFFLPRTIVTPAPRTGTGGGLRFEF